MDFKKFIEMNKERIYKMAENNTPKNMKGIPIITKDDEWRNEDCWDEAYCCSQEK